MDALDHVRLAIAIVEGEAAKNRVRVVETDDKARSEQLVENGRYLSIARTELQDAENWLVRAEHELTHGG